MNRAQRRHPVKQDTSENRLVANVFRYAEKERKENARINGNLSWTMIMAAVGLKMYENGKSREKIYNFITQVQEYIYREVDAGEDALTLVEKLEEKTGIVLKIK